MVDQHSSGLSRVQPQDVAVFVIFLAAVFIFRAPDVHELKPVWRLDNHKTNGTSQRNLLPLPVIADLESDGTNELVVATGDGKLKIMTFPVENFGSNSVLPHLHVKGEVSFGSDASDGSTFPVALATGCLGKEEMAEGECYQVIVVVTSDWSVYCFSHFLKPLWKTKLHNKGPPAKSVHFKEVAALIIGQSKGGLVVVGGRALENQHTIETLGHNHNLSAVPGESIEELANKPKTKHSINVGKVSGEAAHFSTFALDGLTGNVRWSHEPGDFESNRTARENLLSGYHYKLALKPNQYHAGEVHWTQYSTSLLQALPYRWNHPSDTKLKTAHFVKGTKRTTSRVKEGSWFGIGSLNFDFLATEEANEQKNKTQHNAIVVHNRKGIEVLNLQSGQPMCHYTFTQGTTLGDINGDDVIDHVRSHFSAQKDIQSEFPTCSAVVTSESKVLFTGPICSSASVLGGLFDFSGGKEHEDEPLAVPPLVVTSPPQRTGIFRHLMGHNLKRHSNKGLDSVFLVSTGKVTSFGPHGEENWQMKVEGAWNKHVHRDEHGVWSSESDEEHFFPSVLPVAIKNGDEEMALLISSWRYISLVSLVDGTLLALHTLPCQPLSTVVSGDFTNDGLTDFVVQCRESYLGFSLDRHAGYLWTVVWLVCGGLVAVVALAILRFVEEELI